jgi:8-oxo-dGTP pyrophosphatase MutT (NUDIX family)
MKQIRCKAIVIFQYKDKFLFTDCIEPSSGQKFYIPVGGGVEFGEYSLDAAIREVQEEIGEEIENVRLITISENIFDYNTINEHEIVFVYKADLKNKESYFSSLNGGLNAEGKEIKLIWAGLDEIKQKNISLYPGNLMQILEKIILHQAK